MPKLLQPTSQVPKYNKLARPSKYPCIKQACKEYPGGHRVPCRVSQELGKAADVKLAQRIWLGIFREGGSLAVRSTKWVAKTSPGRFAPVVDFLIGVQALRSDGEWLWVNSSEPCARPCLWVLGRPSPCQF